MRADVWRQVDKLFQATVELDDARRAAYLDLVCAGDQTLRSQVESLLTADSWEWDLIEKPILESAAVLFEDEPPRLSPGQKVGHYEILKLIGKGGMGEVYLARDGVLNRNVALKLLPFDHTHDEGRLQRFRREAETVSALNHPNILTIHELGSVADQQFIATEFVEGETLRSRIKRGRLSISDSVDIALQAAAALAAAHRARIIHRDIKPENIMIRPDGYVKVLDFGLAKLAEMSESHLAGIGGERLDVSSGLLLGTIRYMSPEQASGLPVDERSDIFSLGVVLYEMITGRPPCEQKNPLKFAGSILAHERPALQLHLDAVPDNLRDIVNRMLSIDLDGRYENIDVLIADLKLFIRAPAPDPNDSPRPKDALIRRRRLVALMSILACASAIGFAFYRLSPPAVTPLRSNGTWTTKAPISSPRW